MGFDSPALLVWASGTVYPSLENVKVSCGEDAFKLTHYQIGP